jgi:hypothetical protein
VNDLWFKPLIWLDYRLAFPILVFVPLTLLIWAFARRTECIQHLLSIYWRVASLFPIAIYLAIGALPISYVAALAADILMPLSLWFWIDLNEEIEDLPSHGLKLGFVAWRWAITIYCILSGLAIIPFSGCAFNNGAIKTTFCQAWLDAPWLFKQFFHGSAKPELLGGWGVVALCVYTAYLGYFIFVRLGKQGRTAIDA